MDTKNQTDQQHSEDQQQSTGHDVNAVNEVDASPERIARELNQAAIDEGLSPVSSSGDGSTFELHESDDTLQRDQAVPRVAAVLGYAFGIGFGVFAPAWKMTTDEVAKLSAAWSRVVAKYLPLSWLRYVPDVGGGDGSACIECDAIATTFQVVSPRIGKPTQEQPEQTQETAKPAASGSFRKEPVTQPGVMLDIHGNA